MKTTNKLTDEDIIKARDILENNKDYYLIERVIQKAKKEERERIVEEIKNTNFWKTCTDYFTPEQIEYFINLITNNK